MCAVELSWRFDGALYPLQAPRLDRQDRAQPDIKFNLTLHTFTTRLVIILIKLCATMRCEQERPAFRHQLRRPHELRQRPSPAARPTVGGSGRPLVPAEERCPCVPRMPSGSPAHLHGPNAGRLPPSEGGVRHISLAALRDRRHRGSNTPRRPRPTSVPQTIPVEPPICGRCPVGPQDQPHQPLGKG